MSRVAPELTNEELAAAEEAAAGDEKSTNINDYCETSCFVFGRDSGLRLKCFNACVSTDTISFDNFILFFILLNALFMMLVNINTDFDCFDGQEPEAVASNPNCGMIVFVDNCELMFTVIFLIEFWVKVIAYGFAGSKNTYLTDMWCQLDFVIVASSIITLTPLPLPNVGFLRSFRVLRPLKSLSKFPELRVIISAVTSQKAVQQLTTVMGMLMFVVAIFAIVGLEFFQGYDHYRCRLTAWPVAYNVSACAAEAVGDGTSQFRPASTTECWQEYMTEIIENHEADPEKYGCRNHDGKLLIGSGVLEGALDVNNDEWSLKSQSPWYTGESNVWDQGYDCLWPVDPDDGRLCSADKGSGAFHGIHKCHGVAELKNKTDASSNLKINLGMSGNRVCGSNYDLVGNRRFKDTNWYECTKKPKKSNECNPYGFSRMDYGTFDGDLNWGFPNYDHFGAAFMTVFQSVTEEGWVDIMYPLMDAFSPFAVVTTFMLMMMLGSVLMMNMFLAVIAESVDDAQDEAKDEAAEAEKEDDESSAGEPGSGGSEASTTPPTSRRNIEVGENVPEWRKNLLVVAQSDLFNHFILFCIGLNTLVLALDRYDRDETEASICEVTNQILTFIFIFEMVLMLAAKGRQTYFADSFNVFDFVVVWISIAELVLVSAGVISGAGVSALRAARIFRVFKMAKDWAELQKLLNTMGSTISTIGPFILLLAIFVYIFALIGMKLFANQMHFDPDTEYRVDWAHVKAWDWPGPPDDFDSANFYWPAKYDPDRPTYVPRSNFDDFGKACITIFQVLTGENWNAVMYDCRRAKKSDDAYLAYVYFLLLMFMGGFVVMNLFLGILLSEFEGNDDFSGASDGPGKISALRNRVRTTMSSMNALNSVLGPKSGPEPKPRSLVMGPPTTHHPPQSPMIMALAAAAQLGAADSAAEEEKSEEGDAKVDEELEDNKSLFLFAQGNPVRVACRNLITQKWFDNAIVVVIVISSLCLAIENPLDDPNGPLANVLGVLDEVASYIFFIEFLAKVVSMGFLVNGKRSYLRDSWNILDFVIVAIWAFGKVSGGNVKALKAVRTVRVLKPLRMINKYPELKLVINALLSSIPQTFNVFAILMIVLLLFGIIGVNLFKGKFHMCDDGDGVLSREQNEFLTWPPKYTPNYLTKYSDITDSDHLMWLNASCPRSLMEADPDREMTSKVLCGCLLGSGPSDDSSWTDVVAPRFNFDNILNSMALLFEITSTEGWVDVMQAAADTRAYIDMQPVTNESEGLSYFYFLIWMFVGAFFIVQVVVAVLCDQFERIKTENEEKGQGLFTTTAQQQWKETLKWAIKIKPKKKLKPWFKPMYDIFDPFDGSRLFEHFIMACILLNTLTMSFKYIEMPDGMTNTLNVFNLIFAAIFTVEMVLKLLALGWSQYIADAWNKFDFIIVIGTLAGIILEAAGGIEIGSVASIVRMFRIGRILRLTKSMPEMRRIFESIITALPSMMNVMSLLGIGLFIYAALFVQLFATLELKEDFNEHGNFQDFGVAMLTLVRFLTGENWNGVLHHMVDWSDATECQVLELPGDWQPDWCRATAEWVENCRPLNGCGDRYAVYFFMYSYLFLAPMVVFNLFVGIVLEAFDKNDDAEEATLTAEQCENFRDSWAEFTEEQHISVTQLKDFMQNLHPPMGFGKEYNATDQELENNIAELNFMVIEENLADLSKGEAFEIDMKDIAEALAKRVQKIRAEEDGDEDRLRALNLARTDPLGEIRLRNRGLVTAQPWIQAYFESRRPNGPSAEVAEVAGAAVGAGSGEESPGTELAMEDVGSVER